MMDDKTPKIRVVIRKRPLSRKEESRGQTDIIQIKDGSSVIVYEEKVKVDLTPYTDEYKFIFDGAYDERCSNEDIYVSSVKPLVESAFDGAKVTCFAYGQTGSGKTYTMLGDSQNRIAGLYLLGAYDIFEKMKKREYSNFTVWVSFYEIYCGKLYDLLNDRNLLFAREDAKQNVNIVGLEQKRVNSVDMLMQVIQFGGSVRVTAQNSTNVDSSRSHAILQISLKANNKPYGKMSFIDLAGSQRAADHADQTYKQTRIDGAQINKSLLALKQCIRALDQNKNHTPFRGSKLTMVLKDSFTGYCRTLMIGNISPNSQSCQNTLNTLKYADRVKELKKPNKDQLANQISGLDELSRQLMLPRAPIPTKKTVEEDPSQNLFKREEEKKRTRRTDHSPVIPRKNIPLQTKNISPIKNTKQNYVERMPPSPKPYNEKPSHQRELKPIRSREDFLELAKKHEHYVQMIIEEQEDLVKAHQKHINNNIQLIKQQMVLMNQADKIGSDIEAYLSNLDSVLKKQLQSIQNMRQKVHGLQQHLREAEQVEKLYFKQSQNYVDVLNEEDDLLNHDHLFY